jgi:hypothetical protein
VNEIRQQDIIDLLTQAVVFAGVTNFVGVEDSGHVAVLHEDGEIEFGAAEHFQQFVAGGTDPRRSGLPIAGGPIPHQWRDLQWRGRGSRLVGLVKAEQATNCRSMVACPWGPR